MLLVFLTGPWPLMSGRPIRQSKTTLDPACAQISVLFRPMKRLSFLSSSYDPLMKSTGSTMDALVDNSMGFPYSLSMPEENTAKKKKQGVTITSLQPKSCGTCICIYAMSETTANDQDGEGR